MKTSKWVSLLFPALVICTASATLAADPPPEKPLKLSECPASVQATLKREARGAGIDAVRKDLQDGETWYIAPVSIKGRDYAITVADDGVLVQKTLAGDGTKQLRLADCPKAVRQTLEEEADGAKIEQVDRDTLNGRVSYTAGVEIDGNYYWITVDRRGDLVEKYLDDSDDAPDQPDPTRAQPVVLQSTRRG